MIYDRVAAAIELVFPGALGADEQPAEVEELKEEQDGVESQVDIVAGARLAASEGEEQRGDEDEETREAAQEGALGDHPLGQVGDGGRGGDQAGVVHVVRAQQQQHDAQW